MRVRKRDHITPILKSLHWLPVEKRIEYKVCLLSYKCLYGSAPVYLRELIAPYSPPRDLRSREANLLQQMWTRLPTMGERAFCSAAPKLWNSLPSYLRQNQTVGTFKKGLKTYLFTEAFKNS